MGAQIFGYSSVKPGPPAVVGLGVINPATFPDRGRITAAGAPTVGCPSPFPGPLLGARI